MWVEEVTLIEQQLAVDVHRAVRRHLLAQCLQYPRLADTRLTAQDDGALMTYCCDTVCGLSQRDTCVQIDA